MSGDLPSRIQTVVCVPLTSNLGYAQAPGNVPLRPRHTGLQKDSVANVSQIVALDRTLLTERTGNLPRTQLDLVLSEIDVVLGRYVPPVSCFIPLGANSLAAPRGEAT